jgi:CRP-like cAMP-binding protein
MPAAPAAPAPAPSADLSKSSKPERLEIGEGFGGAQADTMVTGRFAVPRLPTNLGPVCTNLERILFLHCVPLFVDFEPEDLLVLARASEERGYTEGTVLFNQGDVGDEVFVIISGRVQTIYAEAGGDRTASTLGPGDCIGEMSVIDGSLRSTTAVVTGVNTRVLAIAGDTFRRFVEERAHVSGKIIGVLANRLRQAVERTTRPLLKGSAQSASSSSLSAEA